jgi:septal ring factor EnvC (AmiA/AmiB activator)
MAMSKKDAVNEYLVHAESNVAQTDAPGWQLWRKEPKLEPAIVDKQLETEIVDLKEQLKKLQSRNTYLDQHNTELIKDCNNLKSNNESLKIHIFYLLKAAEAKNVKQTILGRSTGMKIETKQLIQKYTSSSKNDRQEAKQAFNSFIEDMKAFMQQDQFDDEDQTIRSLYEYIKSHLP